MAGKRELLPSRPFLDPEAEYYQLPGKRFSFVPRKHLAEVTLPPTQLRRSLTDSTLGTAVGRSTTASKLQRQRSPPDMTLSRGKRTGTGSEKMIAGIASPSLNACQGDYCCAKVSYPASLQDLESSEHPWMLQARELCKRCLDDGGNGGAPLLNAEEMAACLQISGGDREAAAPAAMQMAFRAGAKFGVPQEKLGSEVTFGSPGDIQASWIFEARAYPLLCDWLELEAKWMLDPNDPDQVAEASKHFHKDRADGTSHFPSGRPKFRADGILQGVRNRLRAVPVCGTCYCIYNIIHAAVVMMTVQRRDCWAHRELCLRREREECEKREKLERLLLFERRGDGLGFNVTPQRCSSAMYSTGVSFESSTQDSVRSSRPRGTKSVIDMRSMSAA